MVQVHMPTSTERLILCETPWLCHIKKVDIQSSHPPISVVQVLVYSWHVVEYRVCLSRHISALSSCSWYIFLLSYDQHTCLWFWVCVVTTCLPIVDIAERGNTTTTWALAKSQDNYLERLHEGVQYPIRRPLLSVRVVLVSRLNSDTDHICTTNMLLSVCAPNMHKSWFKNITPKSFKVQCPDRFLRVDPETFHTCLVCPCRAFYECGCVSVFFFR